MLAVYLGHYLHFVPFPEPVTVLLRFGVPEVRIEGADIVEYLETLHGEGVRRVLSVPIGFVSDHLEIMYDIDYEARRKAEAERRRPD